MVKYIGCFVRKAGFSFVIALPKIQILRTKKFNEHVTRNNVTLGDLRMEYNIWQTCPTSATRAMVSSGDEIAGPIRNATVPRRKTTSVVNQEKKKQKKNESSGEVVAGRHLLRPARLTFTTVSFPVVPFFFFSASGRFDSPQPGDYVLARTYSICSFRGPP